MWISRIIPTSIFERILKFFSLKNLIRLKKNGLGVFISIITNKYVTKSNYVLSNYGVWLSKNTGDKTFNLSLLGYRNKLEKFLSRVSEPCIFIDVGANQGIFSILAAKNQNFAEIHAFEPNLQVVHFLENNFKYNNVHNGVIHKFAINSKSGTFKFLVPENHSGAGMLSTGRANMEVECVNYGYLNKVFKKLNYSYFIKIDVEGSELIVLTELLRSEIKYYINKIFIEVTFILLSEKEAIYQLLTNLGFREVYTKKLNQNVFDVFFVR
jgi:FkbM family methyltransferase